MTGGCEYQGCGAAVTGGADVPGGDRIGLCAEHLEVIQRGGEDLALRLAMLEVRCPRCGHLAPEGLLHHDCAYPVAEHE